MIFIFIYWLNFKYIDKKKIIIYTLYYINFYNSLLLLLICTIVENIY